MNVKHYPLIVLMAACAATASAQKSVPDSTSAPLTVQGDTLREVIIDGDRELPVEQAIRQSIGIVPRVPSLGDVLDRVSPGLTDKILHPFAAKQRRRERRQRRWIDRIEAIDKVQTFDELLREAYERQMREDSLARAAQQQ